MGDRALHEVYLKPFKACIEAGVGAVMCSYSSVNGTLSCENPRTSAILKNELGFNGFMMTDWWATKSTEASVNSGTDMLMPGSVEWGKTETPWGANLTDAIKRGTVAESRLDDMVSRMLSAWIKLGQVTWLFFF